MASAPETSMKVDDLYRMPDDGRHHELVEGQLVSEPLAGGRHGRVAAKIAALLSQHVAERRLGVVLTCDTGFVLHRSPDTVRGPDVAFVTRARYEALDDESRAIPGAPDLAIEVLSPHDRPADLHAKVADYLAAGAPLVWVVDPERERVTIYRTLLGPERLGPAETLRGEGLLEGFRVAVSALFEL